MFLANCSSQWLGQKCDDHPHALVSFDSDAKQSVESVETLADLRSITDQAGLELFTHFGEVPGSELSIAIGSIQKRAVMTDVLEGILRRSEPHPQWGINQ
jgi:hypothetical protein